VRPTAELIIAASRTHRHEVQDPMSGLALMRPCGWARLPELGATGRQDPRALRHFAARAL